MSEVVHENNEQQYDQDAVEQESGEQDFNKHYLEHSWTLHFQSKDVKENYNPYTGGRKEVFTFQTVEDYWSLFNHIMKPSNLDAYKDSCYLLFKQGVKPDWESNIQGGEWNIYGYLKNASEFDGYWAELTMGIVGENFEFSEHILGVMVLVKKEKIKISIYLDSTDELICKQLGQQLKASLNSEREFIFLGFQDLLANQMKVMYKI